MPAYYFKAKEGPHSVQEGTIEAVNYQQAVTKLVEQGLTPIEVVDIQSSPGTIGTHVSAKAFWRPVTRKDLTLLTRQISDLVNARVPMLRSLQLVAHQTAHPKLKKVLQSVHHAVQDGAALSVALSRHSEYFNRLFVEMVRSGEMSGDLPVILDRLAEHYQKQTDMSQKIRSSLAYPALVLAVGLITVAVLLVFVIPNLALMFDDLGQELPWITVVLIQISVWTRQFWWLITGLMIGGFFLAKQAMKKPAHQKNFFRFVSRVPLLGSYLQEVDVSRVAYTLGTLIQSGVPLTAALRSASTVTANTVLKEELGKMSDYLSEGTGLHQALKQSRYFPEVAIQIISVAEETGHVEEGLNRVAVIFERQADEKTRLLISLLGPLVLTLIVLFVGAIVIAVLMPIFQMNLLIS